MNAARRLLPPLTVLTGAFVAALAMTTTVRQNFAFVAGSNRLDIFIYSAASATCLAAIAAVVTAVFATSKRSALVAAAVAALALAALSLTTFPVQLHLRAIAAGAVLGAVAAVTGLTRKLQYALLFGFVGGAGVSSVLQNVPRRYADYVGSNFPQTTQTPLLIALIVFAVLMALCLWANAFDEPSLVPARRRVLVVGMVVPVVGLMLYRMFERSVDSLGVGGAMQSRWLLGLAVVPLLVGAAFALPGVTGAILLAALVLLSAPTVGALTTQSLVVVVAMLVLGGVVGRRRPSPLVAFGVLAVVATTGVLTAPSFEIVTSVATLVVLPFGMGMAYASLLPTTAPVAVMSATTPIAVSVPIVAEYGWTAYTPLRSIEPTFSPSTWVWTSTGISVASILVAGVAFVVLRRRRESTGS